MKEMKNKYKSQAEMVQRMADLIKIVKINEVSLNIDSLITSKVDPKVVGIIFSEVFNIERVELLADKTIPSEVEKMWQLRERTKARPAKKDPAEQTVKKISQVTGETFTILNGLSKNMMAGNLVNPTGSMLSYLHIMNIKINRHGWGTLSRGLVST